MEFIKKHRNIIPFVVATLLIIYLMPREGKFQYEFQKGKVWQHTTLVAPFDFPIYKNESELATERKQTVASITPFYKRDSNVYRAQMAELGSIYYNMLSQMNSLEAEAFTQEEYSNLVVTILQKLRQQVELVYSKGIREPNSIAEGYLNNENSTLVVQNGALSELLSGKECFTPQSAYQHILSQLQPLWTEGSKEQKFFVKLDAQSLLKPNLMFDERLTTQSRAQRLSSISPTKGMVSAGQQIIAQGEVVNANAYSILSSLRQEYEQRVGYAGSTWLLLLGQLVLTLFFMSSLYIYIVILGGKNQPGFKKNSFLMMLLLAFFGLTLWISKTNIASVYVIPFAILPIFVSTFFDSRLALFMHCVTTLLATLILPNGYEFLLLTFFAGIAAVFSTRHVYRRGKLYQTMLVVFATYCISYMALTLIKDDSVSMVWHTYLWFALNVGLMLASYQLVYIFEKVFGFTSDSTLMELSDTNHALLRELAEVAPATFQHSLQVANLAESVIRQIGGNPLLVRAGALYHDVGKMTNPIYFVENQPSDFSPHQHLEPEESAAIIVHHVSDGVAIARKHRLPEWVISTGLPTKISSKTAERSK